MNEKNKQFDHYLKQIEESELVKGKTSFQKQDLFEFLMKVDGQEYGNEVVIWKTHHFLFKVPETGAEPPITFSNAGFTRFYKRPEVRKESSFSPVKESLARGYNEAFDKALDRKDPQAIVDYNRENYFGTDERFVTQGKIQDFNTDFDKIAEPIENWMNQNPTGILNVCRIHCEFSAYSEKNNCLYVTTKEGKIKSLNMEDPEYQKLDETNKTFFNEIAQDKRRFKVGDQNLNLSEMLDSGMRVESIFSKIKEAMEKDEVLGNYQPNLLLMVNLEVDPSAMKIGKITEFAYEHSPLLVHNPNEALTYLQNHVEFFSAPFSKGESFQAWTKTLNKDELKTLAWITDVNQKLIGDKYPQYVEAIMGDPVMEDKSGLLYGNPNKMKKFLSQDEHCVPLILELKYKQPDSEGIPVAVSKLIESWEQWNGAQKIKEWEEKIAPYKGGSSVLPREGVTREEERWLDIKKMLNQTDRFDELVIIFQEYSRILSSTEYEALFSSQHLSQLNEEALGRLRMVELYIQIQQVNKQVQDTLLVLDQKVQSEKVVQQKSISDIHRDQALSEFEKVAQLTERAKELQALFTTLDFNLSDEFKKIQNSIKVDYQANHCSFDRYQAYLEKIEDLYVRLEQKIAYFEPKLEMARNPAEAVSQVPEKKENWLLSFFKQLWSGFRNLVLGRPLPSKEKEEEKPRSHPSSPERGALEKISTLRFSFFNATEAKTASEPSPEEGVKQRKG